MREKRTGQEPEDALWPIEVALHHAAEWQPDEELPSTLGLTPTALAAQLRAGYARHRMKQAARKVASGVAVCLLLLVVVGRIWQGQFQGNGATVASDTSAIRQPVMTKTVMVRPPTNSATSATLVESPAPSLTSASITSIVPPVERVARLHPRRPHSYHHRRQREAVPLFKARPTDVPMAKRHSQAVAVADNVAPIAAERDTYGVIAQGYIEERTQTADGKPAIRLRPVLVDIPMGSVVAPTAPGTARPKSELTMVSLNRDPDQ